MTTIFINKEKMKNSRRYIFGFIGTFGPWHGINILKEIIPILVRKYPEMHFLLIGDGALKKGLEHHFEQLGVISAVTFTGVIEQHKAPEYLSVCDAYLCPTQPNPDGTRFFGSPTKLFEYMSMARPLIASNLEQVAEVVSPACKITGATQKIKTIADEVGFVVEPLDVEGFIKACELCISLSKEDQYILGKNAREKVLRQYTWTQHVQKIVKRLET